MEKSQRLLTQKIQLCKLQFSKFNKVDQKCMNFISSHICEFFISQNDSDNFPDEQSLEKLDTGDRHMAIS